ncbi:ral GTPase-activating protein subunit beta-like isoform X2 [Apostichopus japonicus]|uniref:ral GTPase-activating protein subunit beta-like isoform X2 n=1 Tax=Stichopus japonicus TaxID=307972 RepID=UPI003AB414F1
MYSEWASLQQPIEAGVESRSVLDCFPESVGREVAVNVVRELAASLSPGSVSSHESAPLFPGLETEKQVLWTMEVICYGLSLPLSEHEALRHCVSVYCEWLAVLTIPHQSLPSPLFRDPNLYAQKICQHFVNLFKVKDQGDTDLSKQVVLCHRVLRTIQSVASSSNLMSRETWEVLLKFMLTINSNLLSPPLEQGSLAEHLCERLLQVMFEIWLLACARCFPPPTLWRTLREMCAGWRHHMETVVQWNRVCKVLTSKLLRSLYGPNFPPLKVDLSDDQIVPVEMDPDTLAQTWFRFLHIMTNPVDICHPEVIGQTPKFMSYAITHESTIDPIQHACLKTLPQIYLKAMSGLSVMVDAFLGMPSDQSQQTTMELNDSQRSRVSSISVPSDTPPQVRKVMKSHASSSSGFGTGGATPPLPPISSFMDKPSTDSFVPKRSDCNSIVHLFGAWLFEAALTGCKLHKGEDKVPSQPRRITFAYGLSMANATTIAYNITNQPITASVGKVARRQSSLSNTPELPGPSKVTYQQQARPVGQPTAPSVGPSRIVQDKSLDPQTYEAGRAEACGSLCRIFTRKQCNEEIQTVYLARYYLTLTEGLKTEEPLSGLVLSSILFNAQDLFRIDLKGVQVLVPAVLQALELVLAERDILFRSIVSQQQLKRAGIHLLISLVCLPHHFKNLKIQALLKSVDAEGDHKTVANDVTFLSLKPRLVGLMLDALKCETDPYNLQMLLGSLYLCILDSALCEEYNKKKEAKQKEKMTTETKEDDIKTEAGGRSASPDSPIIMQRHYSTWLLLVECCHLVCEKLVSDWRMEYFVSLTALELLSGLARVKIHVEDPLELKKIVKSISYLIEHQCSWPSMYHSRDLHSVIVTAYHCLTVWLLEHSDLLMDRECLHCVLEVVELGISGSKSQVPTSATPEMKHTKQSKPASMRVREAAEGVLSNVLNHVGTFPSPCGPTSIVSLLDEETLLSYLDYTRSDQAKFRYFVLENTTLVAILEEHLGDTEVLSPTVVMVIRGPGGRTVWSLRHRHCSRMDQEDGGCSLHYPNHPEPKEDVGTHHDFKVRNFPPSVEMAPLTKGDKSIPLLQDIETPTLNADHEIIAGLIDKQIEYEEFTREKASEEIENAGYPNRHMEAKPPRPKEDFSPARLLLSHLGYLSLENLMEDPSSPLPPALVSLDCTSMVFPSDLKILDSISSRTFDTVFIFYMKSGQRSASDILANVNSKHLVNSQFLEFLHSLGWPVVIGEHPGWTGNMMTSWKVDLDSHDSSEKKELSHGGSLYNGRKQVLYFADALSEVAFVVPNLPEAKTSSSETSKRDSFISEDSIDSSTSSIGLPLPPLASNNNNKDDSPRKSAGSDTRKTSTKGGPFTFPDMKVIVVWVENFDDCKHFPLGDIIPETNTGTEEFLAASLSSMPKPSEAGIMVIFIHALRSGLYRVAMKSSSTLAVPLIDGMVVSRRTLGAVVRQTAVNVCNRKRLESDNYSPPHVRRRQKIQDMVHKYHKRMNVPQFLASLFDQDT